MTPDETFLGRRFVRIEWHENTWAFGFTDGVVLSVECLWRLLEGASIVVTSEDHGQKFGLPAPVDAVAWVQARLADAQVAGVEYREGTNDLRLVFASGHTLEVLSTSIGYEMWHLYHKGEERHAVGGQLHAPLRIIQG
jgi:hypothetical protein